MKLFRLLAAFVFIAFPFAAHASTTIFLLSGGSWTVPSDWDSSNNTIEVISGGGGGGNGVTGHSAGAGGAGATYAKIVNATLTPGAVVTVAVGTGGAAQTAGGATYLCNSNSNCASLAGTAVIVGAPGGGGATTVTGGLATSTGAVGSTINIGGNGGSYTGSNSGAAGGGGAGGLNGVGAAGGDQTSGSTAGAGAPGTGGGAADGGTAGVPISGVQTTGGSGGNNNLGAGSGAGGVGNAPGVAGTVGGGGGGAGAGAGTVAHAGGAGGAGTEWDSTHGSGAGGGGPSAGADNNGLNNGSSGGLYGGGGSGGTGAFLAAATGGTGAQGIIVITYNTSGSPHITVNTPATQVVSVSFTLTGTYTVNTPAALDYQIDSGSWTAATSPTISGGNYSFSISVGSTGAHTISVRDHTATSVSGISGSFQVNASGATINVNTPATQPANVAFTLSGTYTGSTPSALDYQEDGGSWVAASSPAISGGNYSFSVTFAHAGTHTIGVRDHNATSVFGTSGSFAINATFLPNNSAFSYSPYNWSTNSSVAITINGGAWFSIGFSGSTCEMNFDTSQMVTSPSEIYYQIDGYSTRAVVNLTQGAGITNVTCTIPTETAWQPVHYLRVEVKSTTEFQAPGGISGQRWNVGSSPNTAVKFTGLTTDGNATVATKQSSGNKRLLVLGDSLVEGYLTVNDTATNDTDRSDSTLGWASQMGKLLGADIGVVGFGGQGWTNAGVGSVPIFSSTFNFLYSGAARSFSPCPDGTLIAQGNNDGSNNSTAAVTGVLNVLLTACPATPIFVLQPLINQTSQTAFMQAGIAASSNPAMVTWIPTPGWLITAQTSGGNHPDSAQNLNNLSPRMANALRPLLYPAAGSGSTTPSAVTY